MIVWKDFQIDHPFGPSLIPPIDKDGVQTERKRTGSIMEDAKNQETRHKKQPARKVGHYSLDRNNSMEAESQAFCSRSNGAKV